MKGKVSNTGYKKNSKDKNNDYNIIPTNRITMKNVNFPVLGISDKNDVRVMYPGEEHLFDGNSVLEYRMAKNGINQQDQKVGEQLKQLTDFSNNSLKLGGNIKKSNIMKAQILKIAGVKSEKELYEKFSSKEAFMEVHGKEFKKAQTGTNIATSAAGSFNIYNPYGDAMQSADMSGMQNYTNGTSPFSGYYNMGQTPNFQTPDASAGFMPKNSFSMATPKLNLFDPQGDQSQTKMAQGIFGGAHSVEDSPFSTKTKGSGPGAQEVIGAATGLINAAGAFKEQKKKLQGLRQQRGVADVSLKAAESIDVDARRQQSENMSKQRNAMMQPTTGEEMFPVYGVGTNVLARNGAMLQDGGPVGGNPTEIQNTYSDEYDIYSDSGYEPLNDSNIKQYYHGGNIHQAQNGFSSFMGAGGTDFANKAVGKAFNNNAGYQMGSAVGNAVKMIPGVGPVVGAVAAPLLGAIGGGLDQAFGNAGKIKGEQRALDKSMAGIQNAGIAKSIQAQNQSYMKDGGWVSHDWTPQVIASFGGLDEQEVYDYAHEGMDTLRAGGHLREYTPPSDRAMETYEDGGEIQSYGLGGQLQTHWGGRAETISHNPYLPGSGETVTFRGQSHTESDGNGKTGIGITYGDNPVEVERGEPMFEMQSGGEVNPETGEPENTGVVFGNMQVNKNVAKQFKDPELMAIANKYHGKKFKNIGLNLSKDEAKQNKIISKNVNELESLQVYTPFDKLKLSALKANIEGADAKLKQLANTKITLANYQNAINDAKEEISEGVGKNISAEDLSRGYIKLDKDPVTRNAKWGDTISKLQTGDKVKKFKNATEAAEEGYKKNDKGEWVRKIKKFSTTDKETKSADALDHVPAGQKKSDSGLWGKVTPDKFAEAKAANSWYPGWSTFNPKSKADVLAYQKAFNARAKEFGSKAHIDEDGAFGEQTVTARVAEDKKTDPVVTEEELRAIVDEPAQTTPSEEKPKLPWWAKVTNAAIPLLRPTDQEGLDSAQLYPEMFAMATNQVEPVPAQFYRPDLNIPYDISYQDQLNANQADYRAAQRTMGYNPAAQASLNAQKYQANQSVLANQFRANQEMKDRVYSGNRATMNQAQMANLEIGANQWDKQALARSNTKATTQAALNSIADKYAKNKLENRTLGIYENMYNYRFDKNGRARNYNPLQFFDTDFGGDKGKSNQDLPGYKAMSYDKYGNVLNWKKITDKDDDDEDDAMEAVGGIKNKNGSSIKKNYKNSSVVRAYKNI